MKHLGDITKISGYTAPPVDVITGGSPCQDLSVVGKRAGLAGERSGLFMEQIKIIKEMRKNDRRTGRADELVRPRYMVWENVPGAFSSNGGEDFRAVLEETAKIANPDAVIPRLTKGKWQPAGCIMGDGWSIAWRLHDAQFWGVPQRRKRIALVADFGGSTAPEILFERKGVSRDIEQGRAEREETAGDAGASVAETGSLSFQERAGKPGGGKGILIQQERTGALSTLNNQSVCLPINTMVATRDNDEKRTTFGIGSDGDPQFSITSAHEHGVCVTAAAGWGGGGNNMPYVLEETVEDGALCVGNGQADQTKLQKKVGALNCMHDQQAIMVPDVAHALKAKANLQFREDSETCVCSAVDCRNGTEGSISGSMQASANHNINSNNVCRQGYIVRRLTPTECERLQGYPDGWTDIGEWTDSKGKRHKDADSPRYKALGNSIALPFWCWMAERMVQYLGDTPTMASLFDGIGGFPFAFSRVGCKPVWASEIEEFPIAVTKIRFPEEGGNGR